MVFVGQAVVFRFIEHIGSCVDIFDALVETGPAKSLPFEMGSFDLV